MNTELTQKEENELAMRIVEQLPTDNPAKVSRVIAIVLDSIFRSEAGRDVLLQMLNTMHTEEAMLEYLDKKYYYRALRQDCDEGDDEELLW